jgi:hypothetical protein
MSRFTWSHYSPIRYFQPVFTILPQKWLLFEKSTKYLQVNCKFQWLHLHILFHTSSQLSTTIQRFQSISLLVAQTFNLCSGMKFASHITFTWLCRVWLPAEVDQPTTCKFFEEYTLSSLFTICCQPKIYFLKILLLQNSSWSELLTIWNLNAFACHLDGHPYRLPTLSCIQLSPVRFRQTDLM